MRRSTACVMAAMVMLAGCAGDETASDAAPTETSTTAAPTTTEAPAATTTPPLYGTTGGEAETPTSAGPTITIAGFSFGSPIEVSTGVPVTITNDDGVPHTWTADEGAFDSGTIGAGESFEYVFDEPGEFSFFCEIHPSMTGTITVTG